MPDHEELPIIHLESPAMSDRKLLVSRRQLVASLAHWGIRQAPYTLPDDLVYVLLKFDEDLSKQWTDDPVFSFAEFTRKELTELLRSTLMAIPQFKDWNLSAVEKDKGVKVDDESRKPFMFTSRYHQPKPEHDFIDLDAIIGNICNDVERDQVS